MAVLRVCSIPDCGNPHLAKGFCRLHYKRWLAHGDPTFTKFHRFSSCILKGCTKPAKARGLCGAHHERWRRHGSPYVGRTPKGEPERYLRENILTYEGDDCIFWPFGDLDGYGRMMLDGKCRRVSRIVCEEVNGPPPTEDHEAAHSCGNGDLGCATKGHLSWKTPVGNTADKFIHGRIARGTALPQSKLTEEQVRQIRAFCGLFNREIAEKFGINETTVRQIRKRERWAWLE